MRVRVRKRDLHTDRNRETECGWVDGCMCMHVCVDTHREGKDRMYTHTHTHARTHARTHAHTHKVAIQAFNMYHPQRSLQFQKLTGADSLSGGQLIFSIFMICQITYLIQLEK